jgi:hypothetical protein
MNGIGRNGCANGRDDDGQDERSHDAIPANGNVAPSVGRTRDHAASLHGGPSQSGRANRIAPLSAVTTWDGRNR